jgi:hypothetical protein
LFIYLKNISRDRNNSVLNFYCFSELSDQLVNVVHAVVFQSQ